MWISRGFSNQTNLVQMRTLMSLPLETSPLPSQLPLRGQIHLWVPRLLNTIHAPKNQAEIARGAANFATIENRLKTLAGPQLSDSKIPKIIHLVFGLKQSEALPFYAKMAVLSARHHNPDWQVMFHYTHEPHGKYWDELKPKLILNQVPSLDYVGNAPMRHYAHKADVLRLLALYHIGGAYLDIDTLTCRSFEDLRDQQFVMSIQRKLPGQPGGLCNAIMLGARGSAFAKLWIEYAHHCRSAGKDWLYDFNAVKLPAILAYRRPELLTVLKPQAFFEPLWDTVMAKMFSEQPNLNEPPPENYAIHLWNNMIKVQLDSLDENYVKTSNSLYARLARPALKT